MRDYHWMVREIARIRKVLEDAGERVVRQYGPESGMPKPQGGTSDPVHMEAARREKQWKRLERLEKRVRFIQERIDIITDDRERTVLDCMLDGMSFVAIASHMRLSKTHINRLKEEIVDKMG